MFTIISLICVTLFCGLILLLFFKSSNWSETTGRILKSSVKDVNLQFNEHMKNTGSALDYQVELLYLYSVDGVEYEGNRIYAGFMNIFPDSKSATDMIEKFKLGNEVPVFYDAESPSNSCLISSKSIGAQQKVVLALVVVFGLAFLFGGIFVFYKFLW